MKKKHYKSILEIFFIVVILCIGIIWSQSIDKVTISNTETRLDVKVSAKKAEVLPEDAQVSVAPVSVKNGKKTVRPVAGKSIDDKVYSTLINDGLSIIDIDESQSKEKDDDEYTIEQSSLEKIKKKSTKEPDTAVFAPLDISLKKNEKEIQPDGEVYVRVSIPENMDGEDLEVWHIAEDGSVEQMPGRVRGDEYEFKTTHFSRYTIYGIITVPSASTLTSSSRGSTLSGGTVYTIAKNTTVTIQGANGVNGLIVNAATESNPAVIYIPSGSILNVYGGAASGSTAAGAGIRLLNGHYLYVRGGGTLNVKGGAAYTSATGSGGGSNAYFSKSANRIMGSSGGAGGYGGGGAGAGIGGNGGTGGASAGATSAILAYCEPRTYANGGALNSGRNGYTGGSASAGSQMGTLYVLDSVKVNATGGNGANRGSGGSSIGNTANDSGSGFKNDYAGGAGGAGGGGGGAGAGGSGGAGGTFYGSWTYVNGAGGYGGSPSGLTGTGTRTSATNGSTAYGGTSGSGGSMGGGGAAGKVYYAPAASVVTYDGTKYSTAAGNGASSTLNRLSDISSNSIYYVTFNDNKPSTSTATVTMPDNFWIRYGQTDSDTHQASLSGYKFLGFYTSPSGSGTQVIKPDGTSNKVDATSYVSINGQWMYFDDLTLYARWEQMTRSFATPEPIKKGGLTASVSYNMNSPAPWGSVVQMTAELGDGAEKAISSGIHIVTCTVEKKNITLDFMEYITRSSTPYSGKTLTSSFLLDEDIEANDIEFTHSFLVVPDMFNQSYVYDGTEKPYTVPAETDDALVEVTGYEKVGSDDNDGQSSTTPPKDTGTYRAIIKITPKSGSSGSLTVEKELEIKPKEITWDSSSLSAESKDYDGNKDATVNGNLKINGILGNDDVRLSDPALYKGTFEDEYSGTSKLITVDVSQIKLEGDDASNY